VALLLLPFLPRAVVARPDEEFNNSRMERILDRAEPTLRSLRIAVETSEEQFNRTLRAYDVLAQELRYRRHRGLLHDLMRELTFQVIFQDGNSHLFTKIIDDEESVVSGKKQYSDTSIDAMIEMASGTLDIQGTVFNARSNSRHDLKKNLSDIINSLIVANPAKKPSYIDVQNQLDPELHDVEFAKQQAILAGLAAVSRDVK
jgi:hypothetical protein